MSPERVGSPLGLEPRELALALQSAVPPFQLVRLQMPGQQASFTAERPPLPQTQEAQDDDLTSLTWLQDNNLLKGMNLTCTKSESDEIQVSKQQTEPRVITSTPPQNIQNYAADQSPTSDYMDESSISEPTDSSSSSLNSPIPYSYTPTSSPSKANKHPHNVKYDPMVHTFSKPPYSFSCLIFMAIEDCPLKALPVKDIYAWILDHFPYFKNAPTGWKNSVRHNLSLNKCFQKVEKSPNLGKGSLWMVDQQYRPNLLQALTRSPFHPCSTLDPATFRSASSRTTSPFVQQMIDTKTSTRLPNPELFPYLARRLAASEAGKQEIKREPHSDDESSLDDVDAATAILALKHGSRMVIPEQKRKISRRNMQVVPAEMVQVITRSPSEDHTYSSAAANTPNSQQESTARPSSPDEAFESDDSIPCRAKCPTVDLEEQRRIEEGADALLNLAGISTRRTRTSYELQNENISPSKRKRGFVESTHEYEDPDPEVERAAEQKFRPRMLRAKRKLDGATLIHQSKRKIVNNNNNIVDSKVAAKLISAREEEWAKHRNACYDVETTFSHR